MVVSAGATRTLAAFVAATDHATLPSDVELQARRLLLDTLGCILGGATTNVAQLSVAWAGRLGPADGAATIVGAGRTTSPVAAAYVNGRTAAVLDADETWPSARQVAHLAAASVAAGIAVTEARDGTLGQLLAAVAAGYEVGARISDSMVPPDAAGSRGLKAGWGPGSPLGAAAAAATAMRLTAEQAAHALGIAAMHVGPPPLQWTEVRPAPMAKSADAGWHALTGIAAAEMAGLGLTGYPDVLDGDRGLWRALGYEAGDGDALTGGLGQRWRILDAALKRWPCQYWMHPAMTALDRVLRDHAVVADEIEAITLATNEKSVAAKFHDADPPGEVDLAFSFPHAASMVVLGVPPGPRWFETRWSADPTASRLRHLVRVELHPDAARYPEWIVDNQIRELPASALVVTGQGTWTAETTLGLGAPWRADTRLADEALADKFRDLALPLGEDQDGWAATIDTTIDTVLTAGSKHPVRALTQRLNPGTTGQRRLSDRP